MESENKRERNEKGSGHRLGGGEEEEANVDKFFEIVRRIKEARNRRRKEVISDLEKKQPKKKKKMGMKDRDEEEEKKSNWIPRFEKEDFTTDIDFSGPPSIFPNPCNYVKKNDQNRRKEDALLTMCIRAVTISNVRGFGAQGGSTERHGGSEFSEDNFVAKVKMEIVDSKDQVEAVIEEIIEEARTGEIGDGKIFMVPVSDVIRVCIVEHGDKGERMTGGRSDISYVT